MALDLHQWQIFIPVVAAGASLVALVIKGLTNVFEKMNKTISKKASVKKEKMELLETLDALAHDDSEHAPNPIILEAKLVGTMNVGIDGEELRALMRNKEKAHIENILGLVRFKRFVKYGANEKTFIPRSPKTMESIHKESKSDFWMYMITTIISIAIFAAPTLPVFFRIMIGSLLGVVAITYLFSQASHAEHFLKEHLPLPEETLKDEKHK